MVEHKDVANVNQNQALDWSDIKDLDTALAALESAGVEVVDISEEIGDGFTLIEDKDALIGQGFYIVGWRTHTGDYGQFVTVRCFGMPGSNFSGVKFLINDGSTGIMGQLDTIEKKRGLNSFNEWVAQPIKVEKGLRRSDYTYTDDKDGKEKPAHTHYFA